MTDTQNTGAMIAFVIPNEIADRLHQITQNVVNEYTEDAVDMHVTIEYLGKAVDITDEQKTAILDKLYYVASLTSPLSASINGIGRFMDKNPNAIYANFDALGLSTLRQLIINSLRSIEIEPNLLHGYSPHVTLAYLPENEPTPNIILQEPIECLLNTISLCIGDEIYTINLTGNTTVSEQQMDNEKTTVQESIIMSDDGDEFDVGDTVTYINTNDRVACLGIIRSVSDNTASVERLDANLQSTGQLYQCPLIQLVEYNIPILGDNDSQPEDDDIGELISEDYDEWYKINKNYGDLGWELLAETIPENTSKSDYAYTPSDNKSDWKLYIADKTHAHEAAVAVGNGAYRGNALDIPSDSMASVKRKVASAVRKYFSGGTQKYLLTWIKTGKKPEKKPESVTEFKKKTIKEIITPSFEFKGIPPDVPFASGVDVKELTKNDPDPLYVIRPLAVLDGLSENNLKYNKALVDSIQEQVLSKRPPARLGHVSEEDASSLFPPEVGLWVGAKMVGNTLYGKCYTYPADGIFREMVRKRKAAGSGISNSIWGKGNFEEMSDGTQVCSELELESIDFAPPERAALQSLGREFETMSEMANTNINKVTEMDTTNAGPNQDDLDIIKKHLAEMGDDNMYEMLAETQKDAVMKSRMKETAPSKLYELMTPEHKQHTYEMRAKEIGQKMGVEETKRFGEMTTRMTEMEREIREYKDREYQAKLDQEIDSRFNHWQINIPENKTKLIDIKRNFKLAVVAQMAGAADRNDVKTLVDGAWESQRTILEMAQVGLQGPSAIVTAVDQLRPLAPTWSADHRPTPEEAKRARAEANL